MYDEIALSSNIKECILRTLNSSSHISHALAQVYHAEGVRGLYKGTTAVYLRIMPHTVLQLLAWDFLRRLYFYLSGKTGIATG